MQKAISKYWPVFVLPTLVAFIIGFIWPFIWGTYLSFQRFTTVSKTTFVGIQNYLSVFQDSTFLHAFGFTAVVHRGEHRAHQRAAPLPLRWC